MPIFIILHCALKLFKDTKDGGKVLEHVKEMVYQGDTYPVYTHSLSHSILCCIFAIYQNHHKNYLDISALLTTLDL